ncbi:MAG: zf-TFIIB domain-containing protein, partial [Propionivibrio sp.]|nr:zf-TFIIB domain-containing protein [Propionivibrio sp.]
MIATPCPACRQPMSHLKLPKRDAGHVELDLCYPCQGIWFD